MRLFISINFDEQTKQNILAVQRRLREAGKGRFTPPENFHLTLAFLGEVEEEDLGRLQAVLDELGVPKMELIFRRMGCFWRDSELWWIGVEEDPVLMKLQRELVASLKAAGFAPDAKRFRPHITLARDMHIGRVPQETLLLQAFRTTVSRVSLMRSNYPARQVLYTELYAKSARSDD